MSASRRDREPAFPALVAAIEGERDAFAHSGMSLRDYFAATALTGIVQVCAGDTREPDETKEAYFARRAYGVADAMLKAREQ